MPWQYSQSTGRLTYGGRAVTTGYSGHGAGRNNPAMAASRGIGPTPLGRYTVGAPHDSPHTGAYSMNLDPQPGTNTFGRTLLRVHGDSARHPGQASDGCIILSHDARQRIWTSQDHVVEVVQ